MVNSDLRIRCSKGTNFQINKNQGLHGSYVVTNVLLLNGQTKSNLYTNSFRYFIYTGNISTNSDYSLIQNSLHQYLYLGYQDNTSVKIKTNTQDEINIPLKAVIDYKDLEVVLYGNYSDTMSYYITY